MPTRNEMVWSNKANDVFVAAGILSEAPRRFLKNYKFPPGGPEHDGVLSKSADYSAYGTSTQVRWRLL